MPQTKTPYHLADKPSQQALFHEFQGRHIHTLRTPAVVIDRAVFRNNCAKMQEKSAQWGASFRAHVKTHKTEEGTRIQCVEGRTNAIVVSTVMEACEVYRAGLVKDGIVKDILYGLPIAVNKVEELSSLMESLEESGATMRIIIDHPEQLHFIEQFAQQRPKVQLWSAFLKVDAGSKRAGLEPASQQFHTLLHAALHSPSISIYGFYCHAGHSYASTSLPEAATFLSQEVSTVNQAASLALQMIEDNPDLPKRTTPFVLSVGSTPTAHAASEETRARLASELHGTLELHAGNYPLLDLQQLHTGLIDPKSIAQRVLATVISYYPGRGKGGTDEAMVDAGAIALSKDTGPSGTFGEIVGKSWKLGRLSQEHGILTIDKPVEGEDTLKLGDIVDIIGQHACLILAAYQWYFIVDSEKDPNADTVVDVWVPWKGW